MAAPPPVIAWPSLSEQLQKDQVQPGSALEKLVRDNQEFSLLPTGCGEETEGEAVPPWLRVLFHKNHPEFAPRGQCPAGDYPEFLERIYVWMLAHQDLKPVSPPPVKAPRSLAATPVTNLRISGAAADPRSESDIRINPWDPTRIVAAANDLFGNGAEQAQFYSTDSGSTWSQSTLPLQPGDSFQADPAVDWTSDGTAWASTVGVNATATSASIQVYKLVGGVWIWDRTLISPNGQNISDKDMLWVDHSSASPHKDNIYDIWTDQFEVHTFVGRKPGPGGTWSIIEVSTDFYSGGTNGSDIKTNARGDVFAFYPRFVDHKLLLAKSTDGGVTFSSPTVFANTYAAQSIPVPASSVGHSGTITYISADAYSALGKDNVYTVWRDLSGEAGCTTSTQAPGTNASSSCKTRIWFTRSTDGGLSWEAPRMVNNQPAPAPPALPNDQFNPRLAIDESNGVLGVIYYDTIGDTATRKKTDVWFQTSRDDGVTWSSSVKVTTAQSDETVASRNFYQYGDYNGLSAAGGVFAATWTDNRNGIEEIWTARLPEDAPPTAVFTTSCTRNSCQADGSASTDDHGITGYQWNWGDGQTSTGGSTASHLYAVAGTYTVTLTVTDTIGQSSSISHNVIVVVDNPPAASFTITCSGRSCKADASASTDDHGIASYQWSWGDGQATTGGPTTSHVFAVTGTYTVGLTVTDTAGQSTSTARTVQVVSIDTLGVVSAIGSFDLSLSHDGTIGSLPSFTISASGKPIAGDWNGDGVHSCGKYDESTATFSLRNANTSGAPDVTFTFGTPGAGRLAIAGDWNHDGIDTIGLYDPATGTFYLRNSNTTGPADITFTFTGAQPSWRPFAGDWDGDGIDTVGLFDPATSTFYLRNSNTTGGADLVFVFGTPQRDGWPIAGDWDGDGRVTIGVLQLTFPPTTGGLPFKLRQALLRNQNSAGPFDYVVKPGTPAVPPVAGDWDGPSH